MANIGSLIVEISANISKLESELGKGQNKIANFAKAAGNSLLSIGKYVGAGIAAAAATIGYLLLSTTTKIANLVDEAAQFQLPVQELQRFQYAAKLAGVDAEGFGNTLQFMLRNVEEAKENLEELDRQDAKGLLNESKVNISESAKALATLGLNAKDLSKLDTAEQFRAIGAAFSGIGSSGERVKLAMSIFGRSGVQVLNIFKDNLSSTSAEFDKLGLGITNSQAKGVKRFDDARTRLGALWQGFKEQTTVAVAPAFEAITNYIIKAVQDFGGIRNAGLSAGQFIVKGLLFGIRGIESFVNALSTGVNESIMLFERLALAALKVVKFTTPRYIDDPADKGKFIVGKIANPELNELDAQIKTLTDDLAERTKPAGERAAKLFGEGFSDGLKNLDVAVQLELDKLTPKKGGGFGSITNEAGKTLSTGNQAMEAEYQKTRDIIKKYDDLSKGNNKNVTTKPIVPGQFFDKFFQGVDEFGAPLFGNVGEGQTGVSKLGPKAIGTTPMGIAPPATRIALDINVTADKDGNLVAAVEKGPIRQAIENVFVELVVGTGKVFQTIKESF